MIHYSVANAGDEAKILDFANYVFSQAHRPHDFRTLLPKVYGEDVTNAGMHYLAREDDGSIRAMLCVLPVDMHICETVLRCGIVGTVSVHPYHRGEGHMKQLMQLMLDDSAEKGLDILVLSGQRQRYYYFGFDYAGVCAEYTISKDNIRHALSSVDISGYSFTAVNENGSRLCEECFRLYESGLIHGARPRERYLDFVRSWQSTLWAVQKNGSFVGSVIDNVWDGKAIKEILLNDESELTAVLKKWFLLNPDAQSIKLRVWPFEQERMQILDDICEKINIIPSQMIRILNYGHVLKASMELDGKCKKLQDGDTIIGAGNETISISVRSGAPEVTSTDMKPEISLTGLGAVRTLYAPNILRDKEDSIFKNWLPLPWVMPSPDRF